ncbi:hypothetical protein L7F22_004004 [Adiantum nelumboides]|nr:hypothetical protein [Adiantum nelumboides]
MSGALSAISSIREARETANLRDKVKVLEGELKVTLTELEVSRQQMKKQQDQILVKKNALVDVAQQQLGKEQSSSYTDQLVKELGSVEQVIQDLADLKRKNMILEDELKDMRQRYFNMSLQSAEVEAEGGIGNDHPQSSRSKETDPLQKFQFLSDDFRG